MRSPGAIQNNVVLHLGLSGPMVELGLRRIPDGAIVYEGT